MHNKENNENTQRESEWRVDIKGTTPSQRTIAVSKKVTKILGDPKKGRFVNESPTNPQNKVFLAVWDLFTKTFRQLKEAQGDGFNETTDLFQDMSHAKPRRFRAQLSKCGMSKEMVINMISERLMNESDYSELKALGIAEKFWDAFYEEKKLR